MWFRSDTAGTRRRPNLVSCRLPRVDSYILLTLCSAECNVWFDSSSRRRKVDFSGRVELVEEVHEEDCLEEGLGRYSEAEAQPFKNVRCTGPCASKKRERSPRVNMPKKKRRPQPTQGDGVLVGLLGNTNYPDVAARAIHDPLDLGPTGSSMGGRGRRSEESSQETRRGRNRARRWRGRRMATYQKWF
jgi:hypothetical protein